MKTGQWTLIIVVGPEIKAPNCGRYCNVSCSNVLSFTSVFPHKEGLDVANADCLTTPR